MSTLQELLNLGLVDIGSDDSRFEKIQSASSALAAKFKEDPSLLVPATLISVDEGVDEDDHMFALVEELVVVEWRTLRNTHVNRPRELLRSIIIDALEAAACGDHESSGIIWNSAAPRLRHLQVRLGKATSVIEGLLKRARDSAEQEAVERAGLVAAEPKKRSRKKASPERCSLTISASIADEDVFADVARAAGPQHPQNENLDGPNPHWPTQGPQWANEFATRMATALSNAVSLGNTRLSEALSQQLVGYLGNFEKQLIDQFREIEQQQSDMSQTHESSRMRLDVLWWSDALYSPVLQVGYRELELPVAAVAAAVDLAAIVPPLAPASICYVLGETLLRISDPEGGRSEKSVQDYLRDVADAKVDFGERLPGPPTNNVRSPLVDLVGEAAGGSLVSAEAIRERAGIDPLLNLPPAEFAMWVFRGIQANRLVEALR